MSEAVLDSGDPKLGDALHQLDNINCPEDGTLMEKVADEKTDSHLVRNLPYV